MEHKHRRKYQPKTTGQINWSSKKDKKRLAKAEQKDSVAYEKQDYCLESPKFTEYYTVSATEKKGNLSRTPLSHSASFSNQYERV